MNKDCLFPITLFLSLLIGFYPHTTFAQKNTGGIKGIVTTADNKPATNISLIIEQAKRGTISDEQGRYSLARLAPGNYTVKVSSVGIVTQEKEITIVGGQTVKENFIINITSQQLEDITVNALRNKFANKGSDYIAKMPLKNLENPQVYNVVPASLIREQMVTNFNDAMKNITGVAPMFSQGGDFSMLFSSRGFSTSASMRDGVALGVSADLDPANIESIDMLKGPAGTLYGGALVSWGGMINITTKKPYDHLGGEISYTGGSYGLSRFTADVNTPLNADSTLALRVNAAYTYRGSYTDYGFSKSTFLAPVISYKPNERLSITLEADFYNKKGTGTPTFWGLPGTTVPVKDLKLDYYSSYLNNSVTFQTPATNVFGNINYKLSGHWQSQTSLSFSHTENNGYYAWFSMNGTGDSLTRILSQYEGDGNNMVDIQQNFLGDYTWGNIRNRVIAGIDFYNTQSGNKFYYIPYDMVSLTDPGQEYLNISPALIEQYKIDNNITASGSVSKEYIYAVYVSDVINLGQHFIANAGLRIDRFDNKGSFNPADGTTSGNYKQTALSPKFGLVYQPVIDMVSIFANYSNGFSNNNGTDFYGKPFKPSNGNQLEGGVKLDVIKHILSATVSYYNIHAKNLTESDPAHPGFSIQDARQNSYGLEASVNVSPFTGFNLLAGYSTNHKKYQGARDNAAIPGNTGNLYASYIISSGAAKGLGFSFGGNYAGKVFPSGSGFIIPAYTIMNAGAFYDKKHYRFGVKVNNLSNQKYWIGWFDLEPQMLREISATFSIKF